MNKQREDPSQAAKNKHKEIRAEMVKDGEKKLAARSLLRDRSIERKKRRERNQCENSSHKNSGVALFLSHEIKVSDYSYYYANMHLIPYPGS